MVLASLEVVPLLLGTRHVCRRGALGPGGFITCASVSPGRSCSGIQQDLEENHHREAVAGGFGGVREGRQDGGHARAAEGGPEHQQVLVRSGRRHLGAVHQRKVCPVPEQQADTGTGRYSR